SAVLLAGEEHRSVAQKFWHSSDSAFENCPAAPQVEFMLRIEDGTPEIDQVKIDSVQLRAAQVGAAQVRFADLLQGRQRGGGQVQSRCDNILREIYLLPNLGGMAGTTFAPNRIGCASRTCLEVPHVKTMLNHCVPAILMVACAPTPSV